MKFLRLVSTLALAAIPAAAFAPHWNQKFHAVSGSRIHSTPVADASTESSEVVSTEKLRNIAVIAHVDHGKTTLVRTIVYRTYVSKLLQSPLSRILRSETPRSLLALYYLVCVALHSLRLCLTFFLPGLTLFLPFRALPCLAFPPNHTITI